jgi:trigger factor
VTANIPDPDVNTVEQLRARLRKAGESYMADQFEQKKMSLASEQMALRLDQAVPEQLVEAMAHSMLDELRQQMESQDQTMEDFMKSQHLTEEQLHEDALKQAADMLRQGFALDAVFRHEGLVLDDDDKREALHAIAPGQEDEAEESLNEAGYFFTVEETAQRLKAGKHILSQADVTVNE